MRSHKSTKRADKINRQSIDPSFPRLIGSPIKTLEHREKGANILMCFFLTPCNKNDSLLLSAKRSGNIPETIMFTVY